MTPNQHKRIQFIRGFTLIELMIVIAIVGILAAIALPSYMDYIRKSLRADGISAIMDLMLAQEKWRANHTIYGTLTELEGAASVESPEKHYKLEFKDATGTVVAPTATGYTMRAEPQGGQLQDPCKIFVLTVSGGTPPAKTISGTAITADRCWQR